MENAIAVTLVSLFSAVTLFSAHTDKKEGKIYNWTFSALLALVVCQFVQAYFFGTFPEFFAARLAGFLAMVGFVYLW